MKFIAITSALLASLSLVCASAIPLEKRAGPSGQLQYPYDGVSVAANAGIEVKYTRVNGVQGFYTESIDVDIVDMSNNSVHRVATGLTSKGKTTLIDSYFALPTPYSYPSNSGNTVKYTIKITEHQINSAGQPVVFLAAAPSFTVNVVGGSACAGAAPGNCGNTF